METVYWYSAVIGGFFLVVQTALLFLGGGHTDADADVHLDVDHDPGIGTDALFLKVLSFKTVVAFLTFFGLTGLASASAGLSTTLTAVLAVAAGIAAVYLVAYMMVGLARLQSRGNLDLKNAVGKSAKVYLRVPENRTGSGKVIVTVQGRKLECRAVTAGPELPTGAEVMVVAAPSGDTLEVANLT